jgi:hypothetical protein
MGSFDFGHSLEAGDSCAGKDEGETEGRKAKAKD